MLRHSYFLLIAFFFQTGNAQNIIKATVISVPLSITSTFTISCQIFDDSFDKKKVSNVKKVDLKDLYTLLSKSKIPLQERKRIDVRGKIMIYFDNKTSRRICFDEFGIFLYGERFLENRPLLEYLITHKLVER
jgi:hypothetical protein